MRRVSDSQVAMYQRGLDQARFAGVIKTGRALVEAALAAGNIGSAADRKKVAELIDLPYGKDTNAVLAHGSIPSAPLPEATSKGGPQKIVEVTDGSTVQPYVAWESQPVTMTANEAIAVDASDNRKEAASA